MKTTPVSLLASCLSLTSLVFATPLLAQTIYRLDPLAGGTSYAYAISPDGLQVGGYATTSASRAYLWTQGTSGWTALNLGSLGNSSTAFGVTNLANTTGKVAGTTSVTSAGCTQGFSWTSGLMSSLGAITIAAYAISNNGNYIAGYRNIVSPPSGAPCIGPTRGFRNNLSNGELLLPISTLNLGQSQAYSVNNSGVAVGWSNIAPTDELTGAAHATLWASGSSNGQQIGTDLGTLGGTNSYAYSINNDGRIVGASNISSGDLRGFVKTSLLAAPIELPPLIGEPTSLAFAINNDGDVAGYSISSANVRRAVWWKLTASGYSALI